MAKASTTKKKPTKGKFSAAEKAAMKEALKEKKGAGQGEEAVLEKIAGMPKSDRDLAKKVHKIVREVAPDLTPRTWYGMPAYANKDGKVVCYFQDAHKFKARYATFGFNDAATIDKGDMWPTSFALKKVGEAEEKKIRALVEKAVS